MRRFVKMMIGFCFLTVLATGCGQSGKSKRVPVEVTVTGLEEVPEELRQAIDKHKEKPMQLTYTEGGWMYAVRGYGKQETGGYSIVVNVCEEDEEKVYLNTTLVGPEKRETGDDEASYPVIVLKMEQREKEIVFE